MTNALCLISGFALGLAWELRREGRPYGHVAALGLVCLVVAAGLLVTA